MRLQLFRIEDGYLVCPAGTPPAQWQQECAGRNPDMLFLSRDTAGRQFTEEHMRSNGAVVMDQRVADIMFAGYPGWESRNF